MFRVTTQNGSDQLVLKFEGRLTGDWVAAADACWREAIASLGHRPVVVDLRDVTVVDVAGRELMSRMYRAGARFRVRGCEMRELEREIAQALSEAAGFENERNA
jgi:anti-anti-sigma regulatory factor